jgi:hypothetical protein
MTERVGSLGGNDNSLNLPFNNVKKYNMNKPTSFFNPENSKNSVLSGNSQNTAGLTSTIIPPVPYKTAASENSKISSQVSAENGMTRPSDIVIKETSSHRLLKLYGFKLENDNKNVILKLIADHGPIPTNNKGWLNNISRFINIFFSVIRSGLIIGKFCAVLLTFLTIYCAEKAQATQNIVGKFFWGGGSVILYFVSVAIVSISTIVTTDSPLAHLQEINSKLPNRLLKFADLFAQVLKITIQIFFAMICISAILLSSRGTFFAFVATLQTLTNAPIIGGFVSICAPWILANAAPLGTIYVWAIFAISIWGFVQLKKLVRAVVTQYQKLLTSREIKDIQLKLANNNISEEPKGNHQFIQKEYYETYKKSELINSIETGNFYEARRVVEGIIVEMLLLELKNCSDYSSFIRNFKLCLDIIKNDIKPLIEPHVNKLFYDEDQMLVSVFRNYKDMIDSERPRSRFSKILGKYPLTSSIKYCYNTI